MLQTNMEQDIVKIKESLGSRLCILAHHYQQDEVVRHADYIGDSLELAKKVHDLQAEYVVMCGVYFMAESAAILADVSQKTYIPEQSAGCVLADMAPAWLLQRKLQEFWSRGQRIIPLAYVNTSAAVKAVCAEYQGAVCTSSNAWTMLEWALGQGDGVLFLPDKNLAHNTADALQIPAEERCMISLKQVPPAKARLYIWPGVCVVHHKIKPADVLRVRQEDPQANVIVHPECNPQLVALSDASGSTSRIIDYVQQAEPGSRIYIGTEINLVQRLARENAAVKQVLPLREVQCLNMAKVRSASLGGLLHNLEGAPRVYVDGDVQQKALTALKRMLEICS